MGGEQEHRPRSNGGGDPVGSMRSPAWQEGVLAKPVKAEGLHLPLRLSWGAEGGKSHWKSSQQGDLMSVGLEGGGAHQTAKLPRNLGLEVAPGKIGHACLLSRLGPNCCMSACLTRHSRAHEYDQDN